MTAILFTVDTELSPALQHRGFNALENFEIAVMGKVAGGEWGIGYQLRRLAEHSLKVVFFVEALSAYALGLDILKRVIDPILSAGQEVQLHLHTEWLPWIDKDPVGGARGDNIADFSYDQQCTLLELGLEAITRAGAPRPFAFRAGNYGADNATLRALASLGLRYDTSYNEPFLGGDCRIVTASKLLVPTPMEGLIEVPITFFEDFPGHTRPLQLCAVSARELDWCIASCIEAGRPTVTIVSHSFELLNVGRTRSNPLLLRRFDALCSILQGANAATAGFSDIERLLKRDKSSPVSMLKSTPSRTVIRMAEQAVGALLYDRA